MNQALSVVDACVTRKLVWDIYVERIARLREGRPSDEAKIAAAIPHADVCLSALEGITARGRLSPADR